MTMKIPATAVGAALALLVGGCSFVSVKSDAEDVLVLSAQRVSHCERLGQTRVSVADKLGFINRRDEDVRSDLEDLARNTAAEMGGDTVSPEGEVNEGRQVFGIYDCVE